MKDGVLKDWVMEELDWVSDVDGTNIGVAVIDGAVTLSGYVETYAEKRAAIRAASGVVGVKAIADSIHVRQPRSGRVDDTEIARRIAHVLDWNVNLPAGSVQARVLNGRVTLMGTVEWEEQRRHVEQQVGHVGGVHAIDNEITLEVRPVPHNVEIAIERALYRCAALEDEHVDVRLDGHTVVLSGTVHSQHAREVSKRAAWSAPGVQVVIDLLEIG